MKTGGRKKLSGSPGGTLYARYEAPLGGPVEAETWTDAIGGQVPAIV